MTYHSQVVWDFDQEVVDAVVDDVVTGLKYNKDYNGGKDYTPDAYIEFNAIDTLIHRIGRFLDIHADRGPITDADVDMFLQKASESGKIITRRVLRELQK